MKLGVFCEQCGKKLVEVEKNEVTSVDLFEYEQSSQCPDHKGNSYSTDEDGIVTKTSSIVRAVRME